MYPSWVQAWPPAMRAASRTAGIDQVVFLVPAGGRGRMYPSWVQGRLRVASDRPWQQGGDSKRAPRATLPPARPAVRSHGLRRGLQAIVPPGLGSGTWSRPRTRNSPTSEGSRRQAGAQSSSRDGPRRRPCSSVVSCRSLRSAEVPRRGAGGASLLRATSSGRSSCCRRAAADVALRSPNYTQLEEDGVLARRAVCPCFFAPPLAAGGVLSGQRRRPKTSRFRNVKGAAAR